MAKVIDPDNLSQGSSLSVAAAIWATGTGADIRIHTSAANNLPALATGEKFEVRDHTNSVNNGLYEVVTVNTSTDDYECDKITAGTPIVAGAETVTTLGATGASTEKSVHFDVAGLGMYIIEAGNVDADGVDGDVFYSFAKEEWKDDQFLMDNAPFPIFAIDADAGKYLVGTDGVNNNGFQLVDVTASSIRTTELLRGMGWNRIDASGNVTDRYVNVTTLGTYEDPANDTAFRQFGTDTTVDDTVDFNFAGPVDEAARFFERLVDGAINGGTGIAIDVTGRDLTRSDGGNWRTDGFIVGGKIVLRDCEQSVNDNLDPASGVTAGFLLKTVGAGVDGLVELGTDADAGTGFSFIDGGGGNDQIQRFDGLSWIDEGYFVGGNITVSSATTVANDGDYTILAITASLIDVATASLTADTADNTAEFGPILDTGTPDITMNASINNGNAFRIGLRVRDGDTNGKTFAEANLATINRAELSNFIYAFPLANATDLKITETDANIDANVPYTGMSVTFHSTAQVKAGLVGGSFNFGIVIDGNNGTDVEVFEWVQRQLRLLTDIDADADTAIGRAIGLLARFVGDTLEMGSGDGGLTFPVNPDGGGSGVFIDNLNSASQNNVVFFDNTGTSRAFPETIAVTLDANDILINDSVSEFNCYYDRTIRTNVTDFVLGVAGGGQITSAGTQLPDNAELSVNDYVRITGLTGADEPMNGIYQITAETTPGADWTVVRWDGAAIVAVTSTTVDIDQNAFDSPGAVIVDTNVLVTDTSISFTAPDTIGDTNSGLGIFAVGDYIRIADTASNDSIVEVLTVVAGTITTVEQNIITEGAGGSFTLTLVAKGLADADFVFNYDFDGNVQGGRTPGNPAFLKAKAIGQSTAQYIQSGVSSLVSGTPLTIPLFSATERNYTNP